MQDSTTAETVRKIESEEFLIKSTASTSQNYSKQLYQTRNE